MKRLPAPRESAPVDDSRSVTITDDTESEKPESDDRLSKKTVFSETIASAKVSRRERRSQPNFSENGFEKRIDGKAAAAAIRKRLQRSGRK